MKSEAFAVVLVFARLTTNAACPDPNWQIYTDHNYRVTVCIPPGWGPWAAYKDRPYFRASDGSSFQFDAADGNRPQLVCEGASTHPLRQFGDHPIIRALKIDGQTACLVVRSKNEGGGAPHAEAQIVVKYPRPVKIVTPIDQPAPVKSIEGMYGELILNGDEKYILEIAKTLRFMTSKQPQREKYREPLRPRSWPRATALGFLEGSTGFGFLPGSYFSVWPVDSSMTL